MRILLDTHALIWAGTRPDLLSSAARGEIFRSENEIFVSAASAWEIATKVRLGRLAVAAVLERDFLEIMRRTGYTLRAITTEEALRAGRLAGDHQDPFDRMIAAQALGEDIPVISADRKLDGFGVRRIW